MVEINPSLVDRPKSKSLHHTAPAILSPRSVISLVGDSNLLADVLRKAAKHATYEWVDARFGCFFNLRSCPLVRGSNGIATD